MGAEASDLLISVWYPARARFGSSLRFSDYFQESVFPSGEPSVTGADLARRVTPDTSRWSRPIWDSLLAEAVEARRNARSSGGVFPVLLWSARHETVAAQFVLSEYLTSHGYIVVTMWRRLGGPLPPFAIPDPAEKTRVLETVLDDLDSALSAALGLPDADGGNVGLLSWSYGGEAASALQRRRPEIDCVVGLSSNLLDGWVYQARDTLPGAGPLTARYVLLSETVAPNGSVLEDPERLDQMVGSSVVIRFPELKHGNFNVLEGLIPGILNDSIAVQPWSRGGAIARTGYRAVAEHVLAELDGLFRPTAATVPVVRWEGFAKVHRRAGRSPDAG